MTSTAEVRQHNYVNEITSVRDTTGGTPNTTGFSYDKNGNLLNDGVRTYQWDAFNRLIQIGNASTSTVIATYVYDALGRRIQKTIADLGGGYGGLTGDIPAGVTDYLYDGQQIIEERNDAAPTVWTKVFFWGQYIDELMFFAVPTETVPTTYRVLSDLLYRSVAIVTTSNVITEAYDCDAYGNTLCFSGPGTDGLWFTDDDVTTNNPINTTIFTGREFDPESQIYYYRARYYAPGLGRFIGRDPLENAELSQGPNLYEYVGDMPVTKTDSLGLCGSFQLSITSVSGTGQAGVITQSYSGPAYEVTFIDANCCANGTIRLVQAMKQNGFFGQTPWFIDSGASAGNQNQNTPGGTPVPGYVQSGGASGNTPNSYIDAPGGGGWYSTTFSIEACAICNCSGKDINLGCETFTWNSGNDTTTGSSGSTPNLPSDGYNSAVNRWNSQGGTKVGK